MANLVDYLEMRSSKGAKHIANWEYRQRATFHIGNITSTNSDLTATVKSIRDTPLTDVTFMNSIANGTDRPIAGMPCLFLGGGVRTQVQILGTSPWMIGTKKGVT